MSVVIDHHAFMESGKDHVVLDKTGTWRVSFPETEWKQNFAVEFYAPEGSGIQPSGTIPISYNGNYGIEEGIFDLSIEDNAIESSMPVRLIDAEVSALPANCRIVFYAR